MDREDIENLLSEGIPVEEVSDLYSGEICIQDLGIKPLNCHEDRDCNDCWIECLNKEFMEGK